MIRLGNKVKDKVTGFTGIATCMTHIYGGTVQFGVQPLANTEKQELPESKYIDDITLIVVDDGIANETPPADDTVTILLGEEVEDLVTGARGVVTEIITHLNGCVFLYVISKIQKEMEKAVVTYTTHKRFKRVGPGLLAAKSGTMKPEDFAAAEKPSKRPPGGPNRSVQAIR